MKRQLREFVRWAHLWLGLITGVFICIMGFSGGLVGLRPQIATLLSPAAVKTAACTTPDWDRAAREITAYAHADINRIYGPYGPDTRYHFRMATDNPILFKHVIFDACEGRVLGSFNYAWMDWTVDLHHNLLAGRTGRRWGGLIGIFMLIAGISGIILWLVSKPRLSAAFRVNLSLSRRTPRELHRAFGLAASLFLILESVTGIFLAFPQTLRGIVGSVAPIAADVRPPRAPKPAAAPPESVSLGTLMSAAHTAIPDGFVRELRMPEDGGNAQIRMWRPGDFRSLGNNVVFVSGSTGKVLTVERYSERPSGNRLIQAMAALHYDEWGGLTLRVLCAVAGLVTPLLMISGLLIWWYSRRGNSAAVSRPVVSRSEIANVPVLR
jgi:uncharacterized iron-regulated membrane protein